MKLELQSAANFLVHLIRRKHTGSDVQLEKFRVAIVEVLRRRYRDHWFPDKPCKGSGYRCIRINGRVDPIIAQAAEIVGMPANTIHQTFPSELTMWIDPLEVSTAAFLTCITYGLLCCTVDGTSGGSFWNILGLYI